MLWINEHRNIIRVVALILFLFALAGPWMFDRIHVPAEYECSAPNIRLERDFCGWPMSGIRVILWFGLGLVGVLARLLTVANVNDYHPSALEYLGALFFIVPIFPFVSNLLLVLKRGSQSLQTTSLVFWGVACMSSIPLLISGLGAQAEHLWGLWLYIGLTVSMVFTELVFRMSSTSGS